ncbi:MAG: peptidase inhibitor family I36 protein [Propionibacteriaceae bacterium]|jgi:hypothetical protein|nr:peptidase inhibitor family I36 protein [Propionibacteriaceae bacterium]
MIKNIRRAVMTSAVALVLMIGSFAGAAPAQASLALPCASYAVCMYEHINFEGQILTGALKVSGYYSNLTTQGFNDKISSIINWSTKYTQSFWKDANSKGDRYDVKSGTSVSSLVPNGFNDNISSVIWTG